MIKTKLEINLMTKGPYEYDPRHYRRFKALPKEEQEQIRDNKTIEQIKFYKSFDAGLKLAHERQTITKAHESSRQKRVKISLPKFSWDK